MSGAGNISDRGDDERPEIMHTEGIFAPDSIESARERFEDIGPTAQVVVKETAKAMDLDAAEYDDRVTSETIETAREVLFASLLEAHAAPRKEFEAWLADHGYDSEGDVELIGSGNVDHVAWHVSPDGPVIATTYQNKREAAIGTLRRQVFGRVYRDHVG
ncbi:MAG: hypothetical protein A07HR60_01180 [uncultured archaeon A07HR60]|nr:MAG: hypothetical protein A07HR60_01180 [uncultured archaeon A07HR60]